MEMLIATLVVAYVLKRGAVDLAAMATGRTPPSHAYRMAKLKQQQQKREVEPDSDTREGARKLLRHWYLDACEDVDEWRANRRRTRPERQAAKVTRKQRRRDVINGIAQRIPRPGSSGRGTPPTPEGAPEVPDNVVSLDRARRARDAPTPDVDPPAGSPGDTPGEPAGGDTENPPGPESGGTDPDTTGGDMTENDTAATDEAGLTPHLRVLHATQDQCSQTVTDVDRIRAQMEEGGVGTQVTEAAGTAMDAAQSTAGQLTKTIHVLDGINRMVLEQLEASQHQAGDKGYLTPESATTNAGGGADTPQGGSA